MEMMGYKTLIVAVILITVGVTVYAAREDMHVCDPSITDCGILPPKPTYMSSTSTSGTSSSTTSSSSITTTTGEGRREKPARFKPRRMDNLTETGVNVTKPRVCGNTDKLCSIEHDLDADGKPDCCSRQSNPMCDKCLEQCIRECSLKGRGVKTCFTLEDTGVTCDCSDSKPTCYRLSTTTTLNLGSGGGIKKTGIYIWVLLSALLAGAAALVFLRHTK
jgi:hypothetical protein